MQDDIRASLDDLAIRWETPRGKELKGRILQDARHNGGEGIADILKDFMYVREVPHGRDLRCITLDGEDLSECKLQKVDLSWASLARSNLTRTDLKRANLKRADLTEANLALAHLDEADCSRADFSQAHCDGTHFKEAKLTGAIFENATAVRASFDSCNLAKANFRGAKLEQSNFFNADCNNANFDSGALERVAERPAKAWGIRWDMDRAEFEKQVGLKAITSRTTKKFKGLDALLKATQALEQAKAASAAEEPAPSATQGGMFFGAPARGTRKLKPDELMEGLDSVEGTETDERRAPERPTRAQPTTGRRPPPPRQPGRPGPSAVAPGAGPRPTARPGGPPPSTGRVGPPTGRMARPGPGGSPPTQGMRRPPPPAPAAPPAPKLPIAPFDPDAPPPLNDLTRVIGQLMQLKGSITKLVIETGDKSRILYKKDE